MARTLPFLIAVVGLITSCGLIEERDGFDAGQVVVTEASGMSKLIDPATGATLALGDVGAGQVQPTFSPDGRKLAWTEFRRGNTTAAVAVLDGRADAVIETDLIPFYNQWDPTSTHVASLGSLGAEVGLSLTDGTAGAATTVISGQPLFVSWAADGERLALHVDDSIMVIDRAGTVLFEAASSPLYQVPVWLPGTDHVVTVLDRAAGPTIVSVDITTGDVRELLAIDGPVSMVLDPGGDRLAILHVGSPGAATASTAAQDAPPLVRRGLFLLELDSGEVDEVIDGDRGALFWSPDGSRLLSLAPDPEAEGWFRWQVHDVRDPAAVELTGQSDPMRPSATMFVSYLPFAEQYAQSMTLWSPDGDRFVFVGLVENGRLGVWIQEADVDGGSLRLTDGDFAAWSPR